MDDFNLNDRSGTDSFGQRCLVTGNPCGTDTRPVGVPCLCANCASWLAENQMELGPEFSKVLDEHRWELYESGDTSGTDDTTEMC